MSTTEQTTVVTSDTTIMDITASSTNMVTLSRMASSITQTTSETSITSTISGITTNQTDAPSIIFATSITSTTSMVNNIKLYMTTASTVVQPTATTTESIASTAYIATTTAQVDQFTTSKSKTVSTIQATPVALATTMISIDETTSAETDAVMTRDDVVSTIAQIGTQNSGSVDLKIIIGVTIVVVLLVITGIVVATIVAVFFKKRGKSVGTYSLPGKKSQSNGTVNIASNGVGKSNDLFCFQ